jgi:hypothetical protein
VERTYTSPRIDKLGVRPGMRVALVGPVDPDGTLAAEVAARTSDVTIGNPKPDSDIVFLAAESLADLADLASLRSRIRPNGAIWIVSRKGRAATLRYGELLAVATEAGLVDNKVVGFSDTHTALRWVIPVAQRPRG